MNSSFIIFIFCLLLNFNPPFSVKKKFVLYAVVFILGFGIAFSYFSFVITQKYVSTAVIYPTSTLNPQYLLEAGLRFGDEKELNELLEVLNSSDVAVKVIQATSMEGSDNLDNRTISKAIKELDRNTEIERGIHRSVKITVRDEDPARAALIANSYSNAAHEHLSELVIQSVQEHLKVMTDLYEEKFEEVALLRDTLEKLEALGESAVSGLILVKSPRYRFFDTKFEVEMKKLADLKSHKEHLEGLIKKNVPQLFLVSEARVATEIPKKPYLINSVIFAIFSVLLMATLLNRKRFFNRVNA
jgi:capsular polysaccharide biosynthesis protein